MVRWIIIFTILSLASCHTIRRIEGQTEQALARSIKAEEEARLARKEIEELKKQIARLSAEVDEVNEKLTRLLGEAQVSVKLSTEITTLSRKVENLEARISFLEAEILALKATWRERKKINPKEKISEAEKKILEGKTDEAIKILTDLIGEGYDSDEVRYLLGDAFFRKGEYEIALRHWTKIAKDKKSPLVPKAYLKMSQAFIRLGKDKEAELVLKAILTEYPKSPESKTAKYLLKELKRKKKSKKKR